MRELLRLTDEALGNRFFWLVSFRAKGRNIFSRAGMNREKNEWRGETVWAHSHRPT